MTAWYFLLSFHLSLFPFRVWLLSFSNSCLPLCVFRVLSFPHCLLPFSLLCSSRPSVLFLLLFLLFCFCCHYYNIINQFQNCTLYTWTLSNNRKRTKKWANVSFSSSFLLFLLCLFLLCAVCFCSSLWRFSCAYKDTPTLLSSYSSSFFTFLSSPLTILTEWLDSSSYLWWLRIPLSFLVSIISFFISFLTSLFPRVLWQCFYLNYFQSC